MATDSCEAVSEIGSGYCHKSGGGTNQSDLTFRATQQSSEKQSLVPKATEHRQKIKVEHIQQVIRASLAFNIYVKKDLSIAEMFQMLSEYSVFSAILTSTGRSAQLMLNNNWHQTLLAFSSTSTSTPLECHVISLLLSVSSDSIKKSMSEFAQLCTTRILIRLCLQFVTKLWRYLLNNYVRDRDAILLTLFISFKEQKKLCAILS